MCDQVCLLCAARDSMLMRFAKVDSDGNYTPPPPANAKAAYATMVYVRATIVEDAGWVLARAVTIAVSCLCFSHAHNLFSCVTCVTCIICPHLTFMPARKATFMLSVWPACCNGCLTVTGLSCE